MRCRICKSRFHSTEVHARKCAKTQFRKGFTPWNRGLDTGPSWIKGLTKHTDERVARISRSLKGKRKPWMGEWNRVHKTGVKQSAQHRLKNSIALKLARSTYAPVWNKGLTKKDHPGLVSMAKKLVGHETSGWKRYWYKGNGCRIKMRSTWEVAFAKFLDSTGVDWLYEYCTFICGPYSYTPDFYLRLGNLSFFVEIKGFMIEQYESKISTIRKRFGVNLVVLMREDLFKIGILNERGKVVMSNVCG